MTGRSIVAGVLMALLAAAPASADTPENYIFADSGPATAVRDLLARPDIAGVQIVYDWRSLEPHQDRYDFSRIEADLAVAGAMHKKLFVQVQDRFFTPQARNIPDYLLQEPRYGGGLVVQRDHPGEAATMQGWVTMQWNGAVRARFQKLLRALAERFDGRIAGINLPETAVEIDEHTAPGFSCDGYFAAELENLAAARRDFRRSAVVQYVNFIPCGWNNEHNYFGRLFAFAATNHIGLGGPDVVPNHRPHMKNAYPFFHDYRGRLPLVAMAVQEPTLTYIDPATGKPFTREAIDRFARDYLGVGIIFWSRHAPWLNDGPHH